jgi:hypothetical protein
MIQATMTDAQFRDLVRQVWPVADNATDRINANAATREHAWRGGNGGERK